MQALEINTLVTADHELHLKLPDSIGSGEVKIIVMHDEATNAMPGIEQRHFGQFKGQIKINDDFDDP